MPKGEILRDEVRSILEDGDDGREDQGQLERHGGDGSPGSAEVENDELRPDSE